jgi:hypothetical protein
VAQIKENGTACRPDLRRSRVGLRHSAPVTPDPIRFDTKVAVLMRDDLQPWQALNVTAFPVSGIAAHDSELIGEPYADAGGTPYLPLIRQPIVIHEGDAERRAGAHAKAVSQGFALAVYTRDMFSTGNDPGQPGRGPSRGAGRPRPRRHRRARTEERGGQDDEGSGPPDAKWRKPVPEWRRSGRHAVSFPSICATRGLGVR